MGPIHLPDNVILKRADVLASSQVAGSLTQQARFEAAVNEGLADSDARRVLSHAAVCAQIAVRFGK